MFSSRVISLLLCSAAVVVAASPHPRTTPSSDAAPAPGARASAAESVRVGARGVHPRPRGRPLEHPVVSVLEARAEPRRDDPAGVARVRLALHVTNMDEEAVEMRFPDGQLADFAVLDDAGHEVWRWSEGRLFTQTMQTRRLEAHEAFTLGAAWVPEGRPGGRSGRYTAVATLRTAANPTQYRSDFIIP